MMKKALKIGFIGGGLNSAIGLTHSIACQMDGHFKLAAGCFSRDKAQNQQTGLAWGVEPARIYAQPAEFLAQEKDRLDAVAILTPTPGHRDIINACLQAKLPVISEKAMVDNYQSALVVLACQQHQQGKLFVTYNYSGYPMVRELQKRVQRGDFGTVQQVMVEMPQEGFARHNREGQVAQPQSWRQRDGELPTVSLDLGVHVHQLVDFITGDSAADVYAVHSTFASIPEVVDTVHIISRYRSGMICNYWYGKAALGYRNGLRIRIMGSKGSAEWLQLDPEFLHLSDVKGNRMIIDRTATDNIVANQARYCRFKAGHPAGFIEAFANYYADIAAALRNEASEYAIDAQVATAGLKFLEAASLSARTQQKIAC